nr:hypothetical protein [Tanacetum cinerariifolium]
EAKQDNGNIDKTQSKATPYEASSPGTTSGGGPRIGKLMITLVNDQDDAEMFDVNDLHGEEVFVEKEVVDKEVNDEVQKVVEDINTTKLIVDAAQVSVVGEVNATSIATT